MALHNAGDWRQPDERERALLYRLLAIPFTGRDQVLRQLEHSVVRGIDPDGSIEFTTTIDDPAPVKHRIPIEAKAKDKDGTWINVLLHVVDGKVQELEFYKDDSSRIIEHPLAHEWEIFCPESGLDS